MNNPYLKNIFNASELLPYLNCENTVENKYMNWYKTKKIIIIKRPNYNIPIEWYSYNIEILEHKANM